MKKLQKIIGKIINVLMALVIVAIFFCMYCVLSIKVFHREYLNIFGYSVFEVVTGSMKESINIGDAVLVKLDDEYNVGDIVTYKSGEEFITHRVVIDKDYYIITKGDANNVNDNPVDKSLVIGRVTKVVPKLGIWKKVLLTPKVIVLIVVTLFIFSILFSYNGKTIKIISSEKAQKEIDDQINDEVNKKLAEVSRRKKRSKKVLDATQIIDINEVNKKIDNEKASRKKVLEATQIIDISDFKEKVKK